MKNYRQFIRQLPTNTVVCALGEFNPPTIAHELLLKTVQVVSEQRKADHIVYTVPSESLQEEKKAQFLSLMFPKVKIASLGESFFSSVVKQLNEKYKNVVIIAGADQFDEFKKLKESASVEIISIGTKDPDAETAKMKQIATKGIYEDFKKSLPSTIRDIDGKRLMNELRIGMGIEPIKENIVLVKDKLREKYFRGEIFNVGQLVESNGEHFEIIKRGSNHLLLKDQTGELVSKWITDVKEISEAVIQPNGTDKVETNSPESAGNNQVQKPKGKVKGFLTFYNYDDKSKTVNETVLNPKDPHTDYKEKSKTLHQLSLNKDVDQQAVQQRKLDLDKEYSKLKEETVEEKKDRLKQLKRFQTQVSQDRPGMGTETKPFNDPFFKEEFELTEADIDSMIEEVSEEELLGLDEHTEWDLVYEDNDEVIPPHPEEEQIELMEVLSRQERLKGKIRLRRTQAKRTRTTKINVHRYANPKTINSRARRLAIKLIKQRMLRGRNPSKVSIGDKENIEKQLAKRKDLVNRVAQRLVVRVRKVEKARMSKGKVKKGNMPSVF
jgi:hypothetical protein